MSRSLTCSAVLDDGTTTDRTVPTAVTGGLAFTRLLAGTGHTCGLTSAGGHPAGAATPRASSVMAR